MPTESVEILIEAQDLASAKFKTASNNAEASIKRVREVGERAKKSTEFFGSLANSLGGTAIGSFASQLAGLTEKTSQFSDVAKTGTIGVTAFRASLVAAGAAAGFQFGKMIGDQIFLMSEFSTKLKEAEKEVATATAGLQKALQTDIGFRAQEIEIIKDPEAKKAAYSSLIKRLESDMQQLSGVILKTEADVVDLENTWEGLAGTASNKAQLDMVKSRLTAEQQLLESLRSQRDALVTVNSERARNLEKLREEVALKEKSDSFLQGLREEVELLKARKSERAGIEAGRNTAGDGAKSEAMALINERDALKSVEMRDQMLEKVELELTLLEQGTAAMRERELIAQGLTQVDAQRVAAQEASLRFMQEMRSEEEKAAEERIRQQEEVQALIATENEKLEERRIRIHEGVEEAEAFRLMQQGISEDEARRIAGENERLRLDELLKQEPGALQATESRLLTRGGGVDKQLMELIGIRNEAKRQAEELKGLREDARRNKATRIEVIRP